MPSADLNGKIARVTGSGIGSAGASKPQSRGHGIGDARGVLPNAHAVPSDAD